VYLTSNLSAFVASPASAGKALSAGMIIMIIEQFLWVFVFGSHEDSYIATAANARGNGISGTAPAFFAGNHAEKEELESKNAGQSVPLGNVGYPEMNGQSNGGVYQANHPAQTLAPAGAAAIDADSAPSGGVGGGASPLQYNEQVTALHACKWLNSIWLEKYMIVQ
jgi:hypothetical protein